MGYKFLTSDFKAMFDFLMSTPNDYEAPMKIWVGPELLVFANTPEILQVVLNSQHCLRKSMLYDTLIMKKGLLIVSGDMWRRHRKMLNPAFSLGILQNLVPTFDEKSMILAKNIGVEVGRKEFDVYGYVSACSLETLLKGTMETNRDIQSSPLTNKYIHDIEE
jgi:cytochrome P450